MSAPVLSTGTEIRFGPPTVLFEGGFVPHSEGTPRTYDVAPNGRFLMIEDKPSQSSNVVTVVSGWTEAVRAKLRK